MKKLESMLATPRGRELFKLIVDRRTDLEPKFERLHELNNSDKAKAIEYLNSDFVTANNAFVAAGEDFTKYQSGEMESANQQGAAIYGATRQLVILLSLGAILVAIGVGFLITRMLLKVLGGEPVYAAEVMKKVAGGDLTFEVATRVGDQSSLLFATKQMVASLTQVVTEVNGGAEALASAAEQVSATAQSLSQASSEQAAGVEETSASMQQMTASITQTSENAQVTDGMATKAAGEAIEAARAGEHGKGFAVVAAEVRKLAERSQIAAQEIGTVATSSVDLAEKAGRLLDTIVPNIKRTSDLVQEISAASAEQTSGVGQINAAVTQMSQTTQQNAASSEELAATSEEMSAQAEQPQQNMAFFRLAGRSPGIAAKKTANRTASGVRPSGAAVASGIALATVAAAPDEAHFGRF